MTHNTETGFNPLEWANLSERENGNEKQCAAGAESSPVVNTQTDTEAEIREAAKLIVERGVDITAGYDNWLCLGFALADGMGEGGRELYHQLSAMNSRYDSAECDRQYTNCLKSHGGGITVKSFFQMAKNAGIDLGEIARNQKSAQEVTATTATTANVPSLKKIEKKGKNGVFSSFYSNWQLAEVAEVAVTHHKGGNGYTFSDKLKIEDLDGILRTIVGHHKSEPAKCDAMILGALNVVSGLMGGANGTPQHRSGIYGVYDGRRVYAPLFNIIYSSAGNDKGSLIFARQLAYGVKNEMRGKYIAEKQEYDKAMAEWEAKGKKERGEAPKEPVYRDPFVPGNSSSSAVYRAMDANGGWGMMFETEADTVSAMIASDYGNYSDLMRKAHHHETLSMNRVTEKVHIDIDEPRLSVMLTCTPGQMRGLFPTFENGLGSRFLFYNIPDDDVEFHNVFALRDTPLEDVYKKIGDKLLPLFHAMQNRVDHPIQFMMSTAQQKEFLQTYSEVLQDQFAMLGKGIRAFVFRIALECFRYAMILTTLRRLDEWSASFNSSDPQDLFREEENALACDDRDFHTAMAIIDCLINHTARVYAVMATEDENNPFADKGIKLKVDEQKFYELLPKGEFTTAEMLKIADGISIPNRTAYRILSKFSNEHHIIIPIRRGVYYNPVGEEEEE
ncbi:DUF3987 domain-containing protein [uncultured Prevotella sp.]|uniref:DUF3987 domain-containing protein n=1 Tax=uncultured Prevotella sp. TaxID=159272 RepID=UPI002634B8BD|nr:DUF3987 domain-containing protein [uncultured Prevotella sp.]